MVCLLNEGDDCVRGRHSKLRSKFVFDESSSCGSEGLSSCGVCNHLFRLRTVSELVF